MCARSAKLIPGLLRQIDGEENINKHLHEEVRKLENRAKALEVEVGQLKDELRKENGRKAWTKRIVAAYVCYNAANW
ncbi:hypothetical protein ACH5RR_018431 [Cinchona calisaya]|uniref:Uncharacterized protein n=1 Tax=Cinchona calisaya TaxID=153742 RepID=A0ABD2ZP91_9GENT